MDDNLISELPHDLKDSVDQVPQDSIFVLFGATGDLAKRKLLPGLFHLYLSGLMPKNFLIVGSAPSEFSLSNDEFISHTKDALINFGRKDVTDATFLKFANTLSFLSAEPSDLTALDAALSSAKKSLGGNCQIIFYLAIPSQAFISVITSLAKIKSVRDAKLIIEKPFGYDLSSAKELNDKIHLGFDEVNVFRIDHFLGKESVQNILALRFANGIFEPAWNASALDHVQIDVPETLSAKGRGAFYDETGAYRDMVVTHLLQVLGFIAMDPPNMIDSHDLNRAREDVFRAIRPITKQDVVFGQYDGYQHEPGVAPTSKMETFVALRVWIDNPRWRGVPFFLRTGKSLKSSRSVITLSFKVPEVTTFPANVQTKDEREKNMLIIDFGDPGSIAIKFLAKKPGAYLELSDATFEFSFAQSFNTIYDLEAYERLLHDVMLGDKTLFNTASGIETLWNISETLLNDRPNPHSYQPGTFGPAAVEDLIFPNRWYLQ